MADGVVSLTAFPLQEIGASPLGNGRSANGTCGQGCITPSRNPASLLLSLRQTSELGPLLFPCSCVCAHT